MLKRDIKYVKALQKYNLSFLQNTQPNSKNDQDKNINDDDDDSQYINKKAKKWWKKFDQRFFRFIHHKQYLEIRDLTTSDGLAATFPLENNALDSYVQEKLLGQYELMAQGNYLHVLWKSTNPYYSCLTSYQIEQVASNSLQKREEKSNFEGITITPINQTNGKESIKDEDLNLWLVGYNDDEQVCSSAENIKNVSKRYTNQSIEKEIYLWERQLIIVNSQNNINWNELIINLRNNPCVQEPDFKQEISRIKEKLMWTTMLKYFEHGHCDKTNQQLQALIDSEKLMKPIKSKDQVNNKKFFETDCKICFCSFNYDSNQVLYCDSCNTSFHLACYGLHEIPKEDVYFCDCCLFQKKIINSKKVSCQICCKTSFPIKQIDQHFYHVTCLMLLNLIHLESGILRLRNGVTHESIQNLVVESELQNSECIYCVSPTSSCAETGLRLKCVLQGCKTSCHPICAYINGCKFNVKKDSERKMLSVSFVCNEHHSDEQQPRNYIEQTYLRRYMCNFKQTSLLKIQNFTSKYLLEETHRLNVKTNKKNITTLQTIIQKTKVVKKNLQSQEANKNTNSIKVETQSRKMLEKLYKRMN